MIKIADNKLNCVGCGACVQACPSGCITMFADEEGFFYPKIRETDCVGCGKCEQICPLLGSFSDEDMLSEPRAFGGYHLEEEVREQSSSGGLFTLFATKILQDGGVVCGCRLDEAMHAQHVCISTVEELSALRGSKYVQSDLHTVYSEIAAYLKQDRYVLFVGTPCQCAGLRRFIGKEYERLLIADFICHGVPSPLVFAQYIRNLEKHAGSKVVSFSFRNKDTGWNQSGLQQGTKIVYENGLIERKHPAFRDAFMNGFLSDLYLRPACHACAFKSLPKSYADFTIADFWGVDKVDPELNDQKGTSLLLIHTQKGLSFFERVKSDLYVHEVPFRKALKKNPTITHSAAPNGKRERFFADLQNHGFEKARKKYLSAFSWAYHRGIKMIWGIIERIIRLVLTPVLKCLHISWDERKWESIFQFLKFAMVGVSNSIVSYTINVLVLLALRRFRWDYDYMVANICAFLLSVLWSYNLNSRHVFVAKPGEKRSAGKTLLKTYVSYGFSGIILNNLLGTLWIRVLGISRFISPLLNLFITVPTNFVLSKFWAYRVKKRTKNEG